jgi:hypothetical protein
MGWDSNFFEEFIKAHGPPGAYPRAVTTNAKRISELERRVAALEAISLDHRPSV